MITKIKLKNWRSHLDSELNFSNGTNALLGHMGSGKTTILDSITFGLFGTFPNLQTKKLKLDDILMKKPIEKDRAEVEVCFQSNGKNYSVKRIIEKRKGTTFSEITEDGKVLESYNASRVTEVVEKILKVNYDLFSKAIYSEQNALDYFLTIPKGQRMKKIDELLMIDRFERARANTVSLSNKIIERKLGKQSIVDQVNTDELEKNIVGLKNTLENMSGERNALEKVIFEIRNERQNLETEVGDLQKIRENLEILKREEKGLSSAIQETIITLERLEVSLRNVDKTAIEENFRIFSKLVKELEGLFMEKQGEYKKLQEQSARASAEVEMLKKEKIDRLEKEFEERIRIKREVDRIREGLGKDAEKKLEKKKLLVEKFVGEAEAIKIKIQDLAEVLAQISSVKAKCPVCESKLTDERKIVLIKQKRMQIEKLKEDLEKALKNKRLNENELKELEIAVNRLGQMLVEIRNFDKIRAELEDTKNIYVILSESAVKLDRELTALGRELLNYQNKLKETTTKKQQFEILSMQIRDYQEKRARIDELINQRRVFLEHIQEFDGKLAGKDLAKMEMQLRSSMAKEREAATKIIGIDEIMNERKTRLMDLENTLKNVLKEKEEIKKLDKLIKELKIFETALEQTQVELRKEFVVAVNYTMGQLWDTLYPYQDFVGIRLGVEEGEYILQLQSKDGSWVNVEGVVSGGERSIACLALRIAFALVLAPQLRILILDEPTANLDVMAMLVLANTLRERIGEFIDQTFLITHQSEMEDAVTGNAYRLERDKRRDEVTKVFQLS
jgi:exonuclease SbcC